jgi:hypothetical protein
MSCLGVEEECGHDPRQILSGGRKRGPISVDKNVI